MKRTLIAALLLYAIGASSYAAPSGIWWTVAFAVVSAAVGYAALALVIHDIRLACQKACDSGYRAGLEDGRAESAAWRKP